MLNEPKPSIADIATYVSETCEELRRIARDPRLRAVSYLLDMARIEAKSVAERERASRGQDPDPH